MDYVSTDILKEGMKVAKDVLSQSKMLLMPEGKELNTSKIQMLKTWGIRRIFIEATEDLESTQYVIRQKEIDKIIDGMFIHNPKNDFTSALKLAAGRCLHRKIQEGA